MAERTGVAVICVRHLNKNISLSAIQRGGGNMGPIGVARAGAFFAQHPDDERLRVMAVPQVQPRRAPAEPELPRRHQRRERRGPRGVDGRDQPRRQQPGERAHVAAEKSKLDEAKEFLRDELSDGPMWAKQVQMDARDAGISSGTLANARQPCGSARRKSAPRAGNGPCPTRKATGRRH
jgi:hypothetical protein